MRRPDLLAVTIARADALGGPRQLRAAPPGTTLPDGWIALDSAGTERDTVATWVADARAGFAGGLADVAGAAVAAQLSGAVLGASLPPLLAARRGVPLRSDRVAVHRHAGGWIDGVAILGDAVRLLDADPDAGQPGSIVVTDLRSLVGLLADEVVGVLEPLFDRVRDAAPFGRSGMWGCAADEVGVIATRLARERVVDCDEAWTVADDVVAAIGDRVRRLRGRPRRVDVRTPNAAAATFSRRCTCCLFYKLAAPGPAREAAYCATCPLLDDRQQHDRLVASMVPQR